jgi:PAS domain-containing protein
LDQDSVIAPLEAGLAYEGAPDLTWLNRRLRDLLMQAPSAIGITAGPQHRWVYVNEARAAMAGRAGVEDFIGKTVRETYPELEGQPFFDLLDKVYRTGVPFHGKEIKAVFNRGLHGAPDDAYVDCVYQPIRNPEGKVEGLLIHTVEVTEQVLARRAVERANESEKHERATAEFERNQLRELFKQAPAAIAILTGPDHRWSFANAAYCSIVGRSQGQLLNRPIRETLPELEGQGFFELLNQVYRTGRPHEYSW